MENITQNKKHGLTIFFLFLIFNSLFAQTLSEKLGGVKTDFTIISGEDTLEVDKQIIIKRGDFNTNHDYYGDDDGAYGYGYGYQSFHLEFTSKDKVAKVKLYKPKNNGQSYCTFHCYDKDGNQILEMFVPPTRLKEIKNAKTTTSYIYSFNLIGIPIVILDKTTTIYIEWQHLSWKNKK